MRPRKKSDQKAGSDMTPMIDMVFQLLIFFILTLKIVASEGDFNIKMPAGGVTESNPSEEQPPQPIRLKLKAGDKGTLSYVQIAGQEQQFRNTAADMKKLRNFVTQLCGKGTTDSGLELELDCDYDLKYENVISVLTACTGYIDSNGNRVTLIEKIKFLAARK